MKQFSYAEMRQNTALYVTELSKLYREYETLCCNSKGPHIENKITYLYYASLFLISFLCMIGANMDFETLWRDAEHYYKCKNREHAEKLLAKLNIYLYSSLGSSVTTK